MKVFIDINAWRVTTLSPNEIGEGQQVEVPLQTVRKWIRVFEEFEKTQIQMTKYLKAELDKE